MNRSESVGPGRAAGRSPRAVLALLAGLLILSLAASLLCGAAPMEIKEIIKLLFSDDASSLRREIIVNIRLPRTIGAALTGGALALCGVVMQAVVRNPLADPYLMGVSAGASLGATFYLLMLGGGPALGLSSLAFIGSLLSSALVLAAAIRVKATVHRMLLAGIAVNVLCSSLSGIMIYLSYDAQQLQAMVFWLMGSFAPANWSMLIWPIAAIFLGALFFLAQRRNLNLIMLGDEEAFSLGVNPGQYRFLYMGVSALITSSCVAHFGMIGFVGIIIPHIIRFLVGGDHRQLVPLAFLAGGIFMVWIDVLARSAAASEVPLSIITGLLGSPFFFWLLLKSERR